MKYKTYELIANITVELPETVSVKEFDEDVTWAIIELLEVKYYGFMGGGFQYKEIK